MGSALLYNADGFSTSILMSNDISPVAVAMAATVANRFGWHQMAGKAVV
jgi:hypothetical protein